MANIKKVAELAGTSPATVSRVINGTANVSPETRQRVMDAIAATEFVPNEIARTLFKKTSSIIGLILPSIRNPYFTQLAAILDELALERGYRIFLCNTGYDLEKERAALQNLVAMHADSIIVASCNQKLLEDINACPVPIVAMDAMLSGADVEACIYCDYQQGGRLAMEHLLENGCKNIVCIQGPQIRYSARARYEGYQAVCRERGIPVQTVECDYDFFQGMAMTEELLNRYPDVDGIIACNDIVAISTYKVLHKRGIPVPRQIQLVGFDDVSMSSLISPELTTICQPLEAMAEKAISLIANRELVRLKGVKFVFPVTLTKRETTIMKGDNQ